MTLHWRERGGPPILEQPRPNAGTALIHGLVQSDLRGSATLAYPKEGATHVLVLRLRHVR